MLVSEAIGYSLSRLVQTTKGYPAALCSVFTEEERQRFV
jgi:hypothetical protein